MNCRKLGYSKLGAAYARKAMLAKGNKRGLNAYKCAACGWWHLGSKPPWRVLAGIRRGA